MPSLRIEHFLVLTDDIDATKDFYLNTLGMEVGPRPALEFPGYWLYAGGTPWIHIAEWESYAAHSKSLGIPMLGRGAGAGPVDHIAFRATDHEGSLARLRKNGIRFVQNTVPEIGMRQIFFEDPNGVRIELNFMPEA